MEENKKKGILKRLIRAGKKYSPKWTSSPSLTKLLSKGEVGRQKKRGEKYDLVRKAITKSREKWSKWGKKPFGKGLK